jgi:hypothetical protein
LLNMLDLLWVVDAMLAARHDFAGAAI